MADVIQAREGELTVADSDLTDRAVINTEATEEGEVGAKRQRNDRSPGPAVADDRDLVVRVTVDNIHDGGGYTFLYMGKVFATGGTRTQGILPPGCHELRPAGSDFGHAHAFPVAKVCFAQAGIHDGAARTIDGNDLGGFRRASEIAGIDRGEGCCGQDSGDTGRLFASRVVERNVLVTLKPCIRIPLRFAVPDQIKGSHRVIIIPAPHTPVKPWRWVAGGSPHLFDG